MKEKKTSAVYKLVRGGVRLCYPKFEMVGQELIPDEPVMVVGNHCQIHGPIISQLFFPKNYYTFCAHQMMQRKEVPAYAYQDFWSRKPRFSRPFYRLLAHLITPLCVVLFNSANTIPVYHDVRTIETFKQSVSHLAQGHSLVVFPEHDVEYNNILYEFQDKFIDIARLYYKKTGKELCFVPMYLAPKLKKMVFGEPVRFQASEPMQLERTRICQTLMTRITDLATALPQHTVIPYRNVPKREYPLNWKEEKEHEETCGGLSPVSSVQTE